MNLRIQPVFFLGKQWAHPGRPGGRKARSISPPERVEGYRAILKDCDVRDPLVYDSLDGAAAIVSDVAAADLVLIGTSELLAIPWATRALPAVTKPMVVYGTDNQITAPLSDLYGCLAVDGVDIALAIDAEDLCRRVRILAAEKHIRNATILVIGHAFPSCSQAASPSGPEIVTERVGAKVEIVGATEFFQACDAVDTASAQEVIEAWVGQASHVTDAAQHGILDAARVFLVIDRLVKEHGATAMAVAPCDMDEVSVERFGRLYSPCMTLTQLRDRGVPAACEADLACLISMMILAELSGRPAFMGNLSNISPKEGWVTISHNAATTRMDGYDQPPTCLTLDAYQGRDTGLATYSSYRERQIATIARVDKHLRRLSLAAGPIISLTQRLPTRASPMRVQIGSVRDFIHRCLVGDHYAAVYGDVREDARALVRRFGMEVLEPVARESPVS